MYCRFQLYFRFICATAIALILSGCSQEQAENLLLNKTPISNQLVNAPEKITDGNQAGEGAHWNAPEAATLAKQAVLIYDLGDLKHIDTLILQADNNDVYEISASEDNNQYRIVWRTSGQGAGNGLRTTHVSSLGVDAQYLKLTVHSGDGAFSIGELSVYASKPDELPATFVYHPPAGIDQHVKSGLLYFAFGLVLFLYLAYRGANKWWLLACGLLPLYSLFELISSVYTYWPPEPTQVSLLRMVLAVVAIIAVMRETLSIKYLPANPVSTSIVLGIAAIIAFFSFYNLGHPQFMHNQKREWTYIHYLDLRQYFPTAKYFHEVGYHDMYIADIAALLEDSPYHTMNSIGHHDMRDLRTNEMKRIRDYADEISRIKTRFSAERWQEYKNDSRYLRSLMGDSEYIRYLIDYGGNATPVWIGQLYVLFNIIDISDVYTLFLAALDPLLLLLMFVCIWRSFGLMTMCVSMIVFGCNDFIMYGTNWGGAILRHDWMFYTGFGLCALKTKRWVLGGALIGAGTMVRAFPFFAYCGIGMLTAWWLWEHWRSHKKLPTINEFVEGNRSVLLIAAGAAATAVTLYLLSSLLLSFDSWGIWWAKVHSQQGGALLNHFGLRSLLAGWEADQHAILESRHVLHLALIALYIGLMFFAVRDRSPEKAGILGMMLMWIIYYPQNYYIHFITFLPLLVDSRRVSANEPLKFADIGLWLSILLLCVLQYTPTLIRHDLGLHFYFSNVYLSICLLTTLLILVKTDAQQEPLISPASKKRYLWPE